MKIEILQPNITSIKAIDDFDIRLATFESENSIGVVQIVHGFGEGIEYYDEIASYFVKHKYTVVMHDQRGFGKMPDIDKRKKRKTKGVIENYDWFLNDIESVAIYIEKKYVNIPKILYGFSMGGNISVNFLLKRPSWQNKYKKYVIVAPWLENYKNANKYLKFISKQIGKISPNIKIRSYLNVARISHDVKRVFDLRDDGVFHDTISLRMFSQVQEAGDYAISNANKLNIETLLMIAGDDRIICNKAIRKFLYNTNKNVLYKEYDKAYHCLHFEREREKIMNDVIVFLNC